LKQKARTFIVPAGSKHATGSENPPEPQPSPLGHRSSVGVERDEEEVTSPDSFDELLAAMAGAEHTFDLVANLNLRGAERKAVSVQPNIILGQKAIQVRVVG
jgi:hypothetical protein